MSLPLSFFCPGQPRPGGSKTATLIRRKGGAIVMTKSGRPLIVTREAGGENTANWRANVAFFARQAYSGEPLDCPLRVEMTFVMPRPKSHFRTGRRAGELRPDAADYHTSAPDALKLARSTEDAMTSIVWKDDSRTAHLTAIKIYGDKPGCQITISLLQPAAAPIQSDELFNLKGV